MQEKVSILYDRAKRQFLWLTDKFWVPILWNWRRINWNFRRLTATACYLWGQGLNKNTFFMSSELRSKMWQNVFGISKWHFRNNDTKQEVKQGPKWGHTCMSFVSKVPLACLLSCDRYPGKILSLPEKRRAFLRLRFQYNVSDIYLRLLLH